MYLFDSDQEDP